MAASQSHEIFTGACSCGAVEYTMHGRPLVTHACFCTNCQRESGSALAVNAWIEADRITVMSPKDESGSGPGKDKTGLVPNIIPTDSGENLCMWRCSRCATVLWSNYGTTDPSAPEVFRWVKVGTLHDSGRRACQPDVYIYVKSKPEWVVLPSVMSDGSKAHIFDEFYDRNTVWRPESLERFSALMSRFAGQSS